jgi:hypothetical protein
VRELLAGAQAAEARGEKGEAIALLRKAAEIYRDSQNATRALKMLRHIRRLEGVDEDDDVGEVPELAEAAHADDPAPASGRQPRVLEERGPVRAPKELEAWCSFCCRPNREVGALVAGPTGTFICSGCVTVARDLLKGDAS